ncbi:MAG: hypothetical protein IT210_22895 [Armatimonadetes bacterium]|nr:hypothetical protein [Armatimonadota bacterium]
MTASHRRRIGSVVALLFLSPMVAELLSASLPFVHFFNPFSLALMLGLYGCGALLVREIVFRYRLSLVGMLLLGCAYGIIEEGLTCKSFFNQNWGDLNFLAVYGRNGGVNWVWSVALTYYHAIVSIMAPILLTQALFREEAGRPWLSRRGWRVAGTCLTLVTLLGFSVMDSMPFNPHEIRDPLALSARLTGQERPLDRSIYNQLAPETIKLMQTRPPKAYDLQKRLSWEMNRLLVGPVLYRQDRFAGISVPPELLMRLQKRLNRDDTIRANRQLLEAAYPGMLASRAHDPFRPSWILTLGTILTILFLSRLALDQKEPEKSAPVRIRPYRSGLFASLGFALCGFLLPGLVEGGLPLPATVVLLVWAGAFWLLARSLRHLEAARPAVYVRAYWAAGIITPWIFLGGLQQNNPSPLENFSGAALVSLTFSLWLIALTRRWKRQSSESPQEISALPRM